MMRDVDSWSCGMFFQGMILGVICWSSVDPVSSMFLLITGESIESLFKQFQPQPVLQFRLQAVRAQICRPKVTLMDRIWRIWRVWLKLGLWCLFMLEHDFNCANWALLRFNVLSLPLSLQSLQIQIVSGRFKDLVAMEVDSWSEF